MKRLRSVSWSVLVAAGASLAAGSGAEDLASALEGRSVRAPDGREVQLVARAGSMESALLDVERIRRCLDTVDEASAWPAAWLVIQDAARNFDVVMRVEKDAAGRVLPVETVFATARREWDHDALETAVREATGRKPLREKNRQLVVQGFQKRVVDRYVYTVPRRGANPKGLIAMLPEGALIREAKSIDLGDGKPHTLALVLRGAEFLPSDCRSCATEVFGHADTGEVLLVMAGEAALEDTLDLTADLGGSGGPPRLPRYRCEDRDRAGGGAAYGIEERFSGRNLVPLLVLEDLDGDGKSLEFRLPVVVEGCERVREIVVGILPGGTRLRRLPPVVKAR